MEKDFYKLEILFVFILIAFLFYAFNALVFNLELLFELYPTLGFLTSLKLSSLYSSVLGTALNFILLLT